MNIATEYASLKDSRPELIGGLNNNVNIKPEENNKKRVIRINENKFMNMTLGQIFDKIVNILPNMYNDYYRKHLETKFRMKSMDLNMSESNIFRETMKSFIFENENIIYLGILILIIVFFLYIIN
jgi:hypothetical protein